MHGHMKELVRCTAGSPSDTQLSICTLCKSRPLQSRLHIGPLLPPCRTRSTELLTMSIACAGTPPCLCWISSELAVQVSQERE